MVLWFLAILLFFLQRHLVSFRQPFLIHPQVRNAALLSLITISFSPFRLRLLLLPTISIQPQVRVQCSFHLSLFFTTLPSPFVNTNRFLFVTRHFTMSFEYNHSFNSFPPSHHRIFSFRQAYPFDQQFLIQWLTVLARLSVQDFAKKVTAGNLAAINTTLARLESGESSSSSRTLKAAEAKEPVEMMKNFDPKIIQIIDTKLRSESIICSTAYIDWFVRCNDTKILPTLAAIKADLHSQWSKLEDSGRISVALEEHDMQVRGNPDGAFRNTMLRVLEQEERDLKDLAVRKWDSALGVRIQISGMYKTQVDKQEFLDYKLTENTFREKRAAVYAEFRDQGLNAAELETAIMEWEMDENQNLKSCNAPADETPNQRSARLTRLNQYRHRVRGGVSIEEERELDEMRAAHGIPTVLPATLIRQNTTGTSSTAMKTSSAKPIEPTATGTTSTDGLGMAARLRKKLAQAEKQRLAGEYIYDWTPSTYKDPISEEEALRGIGTGFVDNETQVFPLSPRYLLTKFLSLRLFERLWHLKLRIVGPDCSNVNDGYWEEQRAALRELVPFVSDWTAVAVTIADNSAALAKALIDAIEVPIKVYLMKKGEKVSQLKLDCEGLRFGVFCLERNVKRAKGEYVDDEDEVKSAAGPSVPSGGGDSAAGPSVSSDAAAGGEKKRGGKKGGKKN